MTNSNSNMVSNSSMYSNNNLMQILISNNRLVMIFNSIISNSSISSTSLNMEVVLVGKMIGIKVVIFNKEVEVEEVKTFSKEIMIENLTEMIIGSNNIILKFIFLIFSCFLIKF